MIAGSVSLAGDKTLIQRVNNGVECFLQALNLPKFSIKRVCLTRLIRSLLRSKYRVYRRLRRQAEYSVENHRRDCLSLKLHTFLSLKPAIDL